MDKPKAFLKEWTKEYLKNKDLIRRAIISITEDKEGVDLFVEFKEKTQAFLIEPEIDNLIATLEKLNSAKTNLKASHSSIVLLNSKENLKKVIDSWSELIKDNTLSLYFINPFSETQKLWIVYPHTHEKISNKKTLKILFEQVEAIDSKEFSKKI